MLKIPKIFVDVRQYLGYASSWPSWIIQLIFKVKRAPKQAYPNFVDFRANHFLGDPDSDVKNANFSVDVCQYLFYASGWPSRPVQPILKVKRAPKRAYPSF